MRLMDTRRPDLIEKAKDILREKGFQEDQIHEEFGFKNYRIDVVGWSRNKKIAVECGYCSQWKLKDLQTFFDEVIHLPDESQGLSITRGLEVTEVQREPASARLAGLKLSLTTRDDALLEIPLFPDEWSRVQLENELDAIEEDFQRFSKIFDALSNQTRLRMMKRLMEEESRTMNFADFMHDLELNPKLVWENARKLSEGGFLKKTGRGKYRCSEFGETGFMMMSLALRRLMEALEEFESL
ncbi:MAG: hypothetical protein NWF14_08000 [Candidatus Bathyarchaeota archaeon]|nr:hypothetical protein [Candidatus Bathyarchaeota archaeon]